MRLTRRHKAWLTGAVVLIVAQRMFKTQFNEYIGQYVGVTIQ